MTQTHMMRPKKKKIGSVDEHGQIKGYYPRDQNFFHQADLPVHAQGAVKEMKTLTDPDILEMRQKPWDKTNKFEAGEEPLKTNLFKVRHGLKDETIIPPKDKKVYDGTDTRNAYTHYNEFEQKWDVSNQVPIHLEQAKRLVYE